MAGVGIPGRGVGVTPCPIITPGTVGMIGGLSVGFGLGVMPGPRDGVIPGVGCICGLQTGIRQQLSAGSVTRVHPCGTLLYLAHLKHNDDKYY